MFKAILSISAAVAVFVAPVAAEAHSVIKRVRTIKKVTTVTTTTTYPRPQPIVQTVPVYYPVVQHVPVVYTRYIVQPAPVPVVYQPIWRTSIGPAFSGHYYHLGSLRSRHWGGRGLPRHPRSYRGKRH